MSATELSRLICKHKERLFAFPHAESFLAGALCRWIQNTRRETLNALLDSVSCPRDENGTRKGEIPDFAPEEAKRQACQLTSIYSADELALVCGGLMLSDSSWDKLALAFDTLKQLRPDSNFASTPLPVQSQPHETNVAPTPGEPDCISIDADTLLAIKSGLGDLEVQLADMVADIATGNVPDLKPAIDVWKQIHGLYAHAANELMVSTSSIADLEAALDARDQKIRVLSDVARCRSIEHKTDPTFAGHAKVQIRCDELEHALKAHVDTAPAERAVGALIRLIDEGEKLGDEEAAQLQGDAEVIFGKAVAAAAVRGKLLFGTASANVRKEIESGPTQIASASIAPSAPQPVLESLAVQSGPQADAEQIATQAVVDVEKQASMPVADDEVTEQKCLNVDGTQAEKVLPTEPSIPPNDETISPPDEGQAVEGGADTFQPALAPARLASSQTLSSEFEAFEAFCKSHWVDARGTVMPAPWTAPGFCSELTRRTLEAWQLGEAGIAYLFARATYALAVPVPFDLDALASADELLSAPGSPSAGRDIARPERLRKGLALPQSPAQPTFGIELMLEALRPTLPFSFTHAEVGILLEHASYNDPALSDIVHFLLGGWAAQLNPLDSLRARLLDGPEETLEDIEAALRSAQAALRTEVATLWSAAGGKLQRTHCRAAWTKFVEGEVAPLRDDLAPTNPKVAAQLKWTADRISARVEGLARSFKRIMDGANVRHQDRSAADSAAQQIVTAISHVADALEKHTAQQYRARASYDGIPHDAGLRLLSGSSSGTTDRLCASMFSAALAGKPQVDGMRVKAGYLINHADIIRYLNPNALKQRGIARDGIRVLNFEDPVPVSVLLLDWRTSEPAPVDDDNTLLTALRNIAADGERRDILAALSGTNVLQSHERTLLHRYALELQDRAFEATKQMERIWGSSNELMSPVEWRLKIVVNEAKSLTAVGAAASASITKSLLLLTWLGQMIAKATLHRDVSAKALLDVARGKSEDLVGRIETYFESDDYRAGIALFHTGEVPKAVSDRLAGRRTIWRDDAVKTWTEPRTKLADDFRGATPELNRLTEAWTSRVLEPNQRDGMPRLFYAVISGEAGRSTNENQKRFPVKLVDLREHRERKTIISCETIRSYFQKSRLNPTFLPQLADFSQIVIAPSPHHASYGASVLDDWSKAASSEAPGSLVVFLAPAIPPARRDDLSGGLRKRGIAAAIIDDVDLCRLCAASAVADGHDFIPFLEILLEQLDLDRASPFSSLDGQHVRLETYTGRTQEALKVALGWSYSRVFSGRKLGKSALLKYVAKTFDGYQLPSGNELSVFFITIAGGESERWIVDCILDEMTQRFGLQEATGFKEQSPAERFSAYMKRFLNEKPRHSVLLILDEADAFVEGQLARYDTDREGSLSFRMMKELPAQVDGNQLPRIRTIFSGYRVTNTRGGVWANAGDVLVLRPLAEEEAVHFLQGMLARIGIALGNHAPFVAMRCGFQPAVLIRFGENLVKRLRRATRSANRETLTVTHDEVLATLGEQGVLDEIKTVVNNNFQGNRRGAVVFGATLLALKDLEPGLALTDGPVQVLAKLREIDANLDWLERIDASPLAEIERNLRDFIDRELLNVSDAPRFGVREYRLRFPHFLPVLTQQSEVALEVRQQIQAIRAGASQRRLAECVLSESALDIVRYWYHQDNIDVCKLVVVGGHWTSALLDKKCGVPDRLGCEREALAESARPEAIPALVADGKRVFGDVVTRDWLAFLPTCVSRPLVLIGGMDLQRTARRYALDGGEIPVEVVALGRLTEATLAWWFEDARALHFKTSDAIAKIAKATSLVPFLADSLNQLLPHAPGTDVTQDDLDAALSQLEAALPEVARKLSDTSLADGLTPREIELLKMAVLVAEEVAEEFDLERELPEYWALVEHSRDDEDAPLSEPGDWSALKLLIEAGLLPQKTEAGTTSNSRSLGRVRFDASGALVRLIKALGPQHAT
ncbi:hypothetical protein [Paraburkholderia sediminicola]|uniref:hypothetical protein n=1 Tax=Paraburkholderia sediminicola TaxID=458836 RepID=UPI0038BCF425